MLDGNPGLGGGQADHAPGVAHQDRRSRALVVRIQFFERHHVRLQAGDHFGHAVVDFDEPPGQRPARLAADHARLAEPQAAAVGLQNAVAGDVQAGIDAENSQGHALARDCAVRLPRDRSRGAL